MATSVQSRTSIGGIEGAVALCGARTADALFNITLQGSIGANVAIFVAGPCPFPLFMLGSH